MRCYQILSGYHRSRTTLIPLSGWGTHSLAAMNIGCWPVTAESSPGTGLCRRELPCPRSWPSWGRVTYIWWPMTGSSGATDLLPGLEQFWGSIPAPELPVGSAADFVVIASTAQLLPLFSTASIVLTHHRHWSQVHFPQVSEWARGKEAFGVHSKESCPIGTWYVILEFREEVERRI